MNIEDQVEFEPVGSPYVETPKKKKSVWPWIILAVIILAAAAATIYYFMV